MYFIFINEVNIVWVSIKSRIDVLSGNLNTKWIKIMLFYQQKNKRKCIIEDNEYPIAKKDEPMPNSKWKQFFFLKLNDGCHNK